jgi:hypothetical protein
MIRHCQYIYVTNWPHTGLLKICTPSSLSRVKESHVRVCHSLQLHLCSLENRKLTLNHSEKVVPFKEVRRKKVKSHTARRSCVVVVGAHRSALQKSRPAFISACLSPFSRGTIHKNDLLIAIKGRSAFSSHKSIIFHLQLSIRKLSFLLLFLKITQRNTQKMQRSSTIYGLSHTK